MDRTDIVDMVNNMSMDECNELAEAVYRQKKRLIKENVHKYPQPGSHLIKMDNHIMAIKGYRDANPSLSLMESKIVMDVYRGR